MHTQQVDRGARRHSRNTMAMVAMLKSTSKKILRQMQNAVQRRPAAIYATVYRELTFVKMNEILMKDRC